MTKHKSKSKSKKDKKSHKRSRNPEEDVSNEHQSSEALLNYSSNEDNDASQYLELNQQAKSRRRNRQAILEMKAIEKKQEEEQEIMCLYTN
jgi:hypothetical protein